MNKSPEYTYIYSLIDPRDGSVRYIGKANNIDKRLYGHIKDCNRRKTPVSCWVKKLLGMELTPSIKEVLKVKMDKWELAERIIIEQHRRKCTNLLNLADGGNQPSQTLEQRQASGRNNAKKVHSDPLRRELWELKKRIGDSLKRGYIKDETKAKLRAMAIKYPDMFPQWVNI